MQPLNLEGLIILLVVGLVAGWLAAALMKEKRMGILGYVVIGVVGAFLGYFLFREFGLFGELGLDPAKIFPQLIAAFVGAVILLLILRVVRR